MAHVPVPEQTPGIVGLFAFDPESAAPLRELAEVILRRPSGLESAERELIATYVSSLNECSFCTNSHASAARHLLGGRTPGVVEAVCADPSRAPISEKLRALLGIAARVQQGGRRVPEAEVARARHLGATDHEIHDTVLIAAAFCMYNRYVDGLATPLPSDPTEYDAIGEALAARGYRS